MITLAVDDRLSFAQQIRDLMCGIDPEGTHLAEDDISVAIRCIEENRPDIVWLDIEMPEMSGLELAAEIKTISPDSNIVFVTAHPEYAAEAFRMHVSGYVLKPVSEKKLRNEIENLRRPVELKESSPISVQCFGNFEVFSASERVRFSRSLSKEAFAYLIDRRGAGCTVSEICSVLWEDRQSDKKLKSQCRVILGSLKKDLEKAGAGDVLLKTWNTWGVDTSRISCDYYDYLKSDPAERRSFSGEYMAQYSWAELTAGRLSDAEDMGK